MESFPDYLQQQLDRKQWSRADLSRASGVDASLIGRWLRGEVAPGVPAARSLAEALGRPMLEVLVAAELLTSAEAKQRTAAPADPAALTDDELLAEIRRRMQTGPRTLSREQVDAAGMQPAGPRRPTAGRSRRAK